jgi:hypothetical protein
MRMDLCTWSIRTVTPGPACSTKRCVGRNRPVGILQYRQSKAAMTIRTPS